MTLLPDEVHTERFVTTALGFDGEEPRTDWRRRILNKPPSALVGGFTGTRCMTLEMTHEFAYTASQVAAAKGMTRSAYIREAVTRAIENDLGLPAGSLAEGMLRRKDRRR